jgi:hypothetical protein
MTFYRRRNGFINWITNQCDTWRLNGTPLHTRNASDKVMGMT